MQSGKQQLVVGVSKELDPTYLKDESKSPKTNSALIELAINRSWSVPKKLRDNQLEYDLVRGSVMGNRITVNGETFSESPEYDANNREESLKRFLKRALYKNQKEFNEESFQSNYRKLYDGWSQGIASIAINLMDRGARENLLFNDVYTITDIRLDEKGDAYAETFQFQFAPLDYAKKPSTPAWYLPGTLTMRFDFPIDTTAAKVAAFKASNPIVESFVLNDGSPLVRKSKLQELEIELEKLEKEFTEQKKEPDSTRNKEQNKLSENISLKKQEIFAFREQINLSNQTFLNARQIEVNLIKQSIQNYHVATESDQLKLKEAKIISDIIVELQKKVPENDLGIYFSVMSLLRLSLENPTNNTLLNAYNKDLSTSADHGIITTRGLDVIPWAKELKEHMDAYVTHAAAYFYEEAFNELSKLQIKETNFAAIVKNILSEITKIESKNPEKRIELVGYMAAIRNSVQQNKLFGDFKLSDDFGSGTQLHFLILEFKKHLTLLTYKNTLQTLDDSLSSDFTEPEQQQKASVIRELIVSQVSKILLDPLTADDLSNIALLTSAMSSVMELHQNSAAAALFNNDSYKKFEGIAKALHEFSVLIVDHDFEKKKQALQKTDNQFLPINLRTPHLDEMHKNIKEKEPSNRQRHLTRKLSELSVHTGKIIRGTLTNKEAQKTAEFIHDFQVIEEQAQKTFKDVAVSQNLAMLHYETVRKQLSSASEQGISLPHSREIGKIAEDIILLLKDANRINDLFNRLLPTTETSRRLTNFYNAVTEANPDSVEDVASKHLEEMKEFFATQIKARIETYKPFAKNNIVDKDVKEKFLAVSQLLGKYEDIPLEKQLQLITIAEKFATSNNATSFEIFQNKASRVLTNDISAVTTIDILKIFENLRYAKAKEYYTNYENHHINQLPSDNAIRNATYKLIKALNAASNADKLSLQLPDILLALIRFLESKQDERNQDYNDLMKLLNSLPKTKEVNDVVTALNNLRIAKNLNPYTNLVDCIEKTNVLNLDARNKILSTAAKLNESSWNDIVGNDEEVKQAFLKAMESLEQFSNEVENCISANSVNRKEFHNAIGTINDFRYAKAFSALKNTATAFKGINPFLVGTLAELLSEANKIRESKQLTNTEMANLCQFLINVSFALRNPTAYFKTLTILPQFDGKLGGLIKFNNKLINDYAYKEAKYIEAEKKLNDALPDSSSPIKDSVKTALTEIQRVKRNPTKEDRVPKLTNALTHMTALLGNSANPTFQNNTLTAAQEIGKHSWGNRVLGAMAIVLGIALTPVLGLGFLLIRAGVNELEKQNDIYHGVGQTSFLIKKVVAAAAPEDKAQPNPPLVKK